MYAVIKNTEISLKKMISNELKEKTLKTNCGGFITVIIVGTGLLYLISMINNYNNGNYLPKVINWDI